MIEGGDQAILSCVARLSGNRQFHCALFCPSDKPMALSARLAAPVAWSMWLAIERNRAGSGPYATDPGILAG
jgi:hypothetical protein